MEHQDYFTRCPGCDKVFKLSAPQLERTQGRVRCGTCQTRFIADEHRVLAIRKPEDLLLDESTAAAADPEIQFVSAFQAQRSPLIADELWPLSPPAHTESNKADLVQPSDSATRIEARDSTSEPQANLSPDLAAASNTEAPSRAFEPQPDLSPDSIAANSTQASSWAFESPSDLTQQLEPSISTETWAFEPQPDSSQEATPVSSLEPEPEFNPLNAEPATKPAFSPELATGVADTDGWQPNENSEDEAQMASLQPAASRFQPRFSPSFVTANWQTEPQSDSPPASISSSSKDIDDWQQDEQLQASPSADDSPVQPSFRESASDSDDWQQDEQLQASPADDSPIQPSFRESAGEIDDWQQDEQLQASPAADSRLQPSFSTSTGEIDDWQQDDDSSELSRPEPIGKLLAASAEDRTTAGAFERLMAEHYQQTAHQNDPLPPPIGQLLEEDPDLPPPIGQLLDSDADELSTQAEPWPKATPAQTEDDDDWQRPPTKASLQPSVSATRILPESTSFEQLYSQSIEQSLDLDDASEPKIFAQGLLDSTEIHSNVAPLPPVKTPRMPHLWRWLLAVLLVALALQAFWLYKADWSQDPAARPTLTRICQALGCELPPLKAIDQLKTEQLEIRLISQPEKALNVRMKLTNQANFAQAYPTLELIFSNVMNELIARNSFSPEQYQGHNGELQAGQSIQIDFKVSHPGNDPVNFEVRLH